MELTTEQVVSYFVHGVTQFGDEHWEEDFLRWLAGVKADTLDWAAEVLDSMQTKEGGYPRDASLILAQLAEDVEADW